MFAILPIIQAILHKRQGKTGVSEGSGWNNLNFLFGLEIEGMIGRGVFLRKMVQSFIILIGIGGAGLASSVGGARSGATTQGRVWWR
jgi:hypothetical protein